MAAVEATDRVTVVLCADWPAVATAPDASAPVGVFHANRVIACTSAARMQGVEVGLRRREAQRRCPALMVNQRDEAAEARAFEPVLAVLGDVAARIEIDRSGQCSFATRGPSRYFGGDEAMTAHVARVVAAALGARTTVQVGTADTRFAALLAARRAGPDASLVVPQGTSPAFLAPLAIESLAADASADEDRAIELVELIEVLKRLGLRRLGDLAALTPEGVIGRFGIEGARAHAQAAGREFRLADRKRPPPDLEVAMEIDPPIERVDQAAFIAKTLAEEFCRRLAERGASCSRVAILAETEHGEELVRYWRGEGALSAGAIADRTRWQLDGWLSGSARNRPSGGLSRMALRPDEIIAATGRQLGFWGGQTEGAERAARAVARVIGILGTGRVSVIEHGGGRSLVEEIVRVPAEAVDLIERVTTPPLGNGRPSAPWIGRIPAPSPAIVYPLDAAELVKVCGENGDPIRVDGRGVMSAAPSVLRVLGRSPVDIVAWAGPWLIDERWWDGERHSRRARLQVVTADGRALLVVCVDGSWSIGAAYH